MYLRLAVVSPWAGEKSLKGQIWRVSGELAAPIPRRYSDNVVIR